MARPSGVISIARRLARATSALEWRTPSHVYDPLRYAWSAHRQYLERYGAQRGRVLLVGMNPGPWGMAQTGVPFGTVGVVRDWFGIRTRLARALPEQHPKYPILGMRCHRSEGSGQRLWGWAQQRFGEPDAFFANFFVWNYCPLLFLGRNHNLIPEALSARERKALDAVCGAALAEVIAALAPAAVFGIGRYAERHVRELVGEDGIEVGYLPHPSPASPAANRDWPSLAEDALAKWLPRKRRPRHRAR